MENEEYQSKFVAAAGHWLELFDKQLAEEDTPVHSRPLKSAFLLVHHGIQEVHGGSKENFYEQDWFASVVVSIHRWYANRYGIASVQPQRDVLAGIADFHGTPLRLGIRVSVSKVEVEGETAWMILPTSVHDSEKMESFFAVRPNLESLNRAERANLQTQVCNVVRWTRSTNLALQSVSDLPPERDELAAGISRHFDKAVSDVLTLKSEGAAAACWELHLAVEKSLKVLLAQNGQFRTGHVLKDLAQSAVQEGLLQFPKGISDLPPWELANKYRYAEAAISVREAVEHYFTALEVVYDVTSRLKRVVVVDNAAFLLKKPKWVGPD
jgi:HEPN domain-containing protein